MVSINYISSRPLWGSHFILPIRLPSASITQRYTVNEVFTLCFTLIYYYNVNLRENFGICSLIIGKWGSADVCSSSADYGMCKLVFAKFFCSEIKIISVKIINTFPPQYYKTFSLNVILSDLNKLSLSFMQDKS